MSVIRFTKEEVADIYQELEFSNRDMEFAFMSSNEDYFKIQQYYNNDKDEYWKNKLGRFLQRAFIANQIAYILQYRHHDGINKEIEVLESEDLKKGHMIGRREVIKRLRSLSYNIYTNDGNYCLSETDEDFMLNLVHRMESQNSEAYYNQIDKANEKARLSQEIKN